MTITATTPPMMAVEVSVVGGCVGEHSPSLRDEIATEHSEFTVISTPVTMILAPPLTHSSIREMSEPLSVSEVPSSLSRYVTYVGDSGKQANVCVIIGTLVLSNMHLSKPRSTVGI